MLSLNQRAPQPEEPKAKFPAFWVLFCAALVGAAVWTVCEYPTTESLLALLLTEAACLIYAVSLLRKVDNDDAHRRRALVAELGTVSISGACAAWAIIEYPRVGMAISIGAAAAAVAWGLIQLIRHR